MNPARRRIPIGALAAAILAAAGLLVAGCGGGGSKAPLSKADYIRQMKAIASDLTASISATGAATTPKTAASSLATVQSDLRGAVKKLKAISPPDAVRTQHEKLIAGMGDFADELDPVIEKLKGGDLQALASITTLKGFTEVQAAGDAFTNAGYDISGG